MFFRCSYLLFATLFVPVVDAGRRRRVKPLTYKQTSANRKSGTFASPSNTSDPKLGSDDVSDASLKDRLEAIHSGGGSRVIYRGDKRVVPESKFVHVQQGRTCFLHALWVTVSLMLEERYDIKVKFPDDTGVCSEALSFHVHGSFFNSTEIGTYLESMILLDAETGDKIAIKADSDFMNEDSCTSDMNRSSDALRGAPLSDNPTLYSIPALFAVGRRRTDSGDLQTHGVSLFGVSHDKKAFFAYSSAEQRSDHISSYTDGKEYPYFPESSQRGSENTPIDDLITKVFIPEIPVARPDDSSDRFYVDYVCLAIPEIDVDKTRDLGNETSYEEKEKEGKKDILRGLAKYLIPDSSEEETADHSEEETDSSEEETDYHYEEETADR